MKIQRFTMVVSGINLASLLFLVWQINSTTTQSTPVLRGQALELVDDGGKVRARLNVEGDGATVLRLLEEGTIRVKLGASVDGSGLVLLNDATEPGVQILAKSEGSSIKLRNKDGLEQLVAP
ncbi:MAG TPA: hypothetical protein VGL10_08555 [Gammaproteobacteria bacterium]